MEKVFFANKVYMTRSFVSHAYYYSDQMGCNVIYPYYLDRKISMFRMVDGKYVDENGIEYNEFTVPEGDYDVVALFCDKCENYGKTPINHDCELRPSLNINCIGITNIGLLTNLLENKTPEEAQIILERYNHETDDSLILIYDNMGLLNKEVNNNVRRLLKNMPNKK